MPVPSSLIRSRSRSRIRLTAMVRCPPALAERVLGGVLDELGEHHRQRSGDDAGNRAERADALASTPSPVTSSTVRSSRSAMSSNATFSSNDWLRVSCTKAMEPTRRTASSSASRASGTSMRRPCSRSNAATVCRLFFTRWWISRMVASFETSSRSRTRSSVTSRSSTIEPAGRLSCTSGMTRRSSAAVAFSTSDSPWAPTASSPRAPRSVGWSPTRPAVTADRSAPTRSPTSPRSAVGGHGIGAGVGHEAVRVGADEPVADPQRVGEVGSSARRRELPVVDHLDEVGRGLPIGRLQRARQSMAGSDAAKDDDAAHRALPEQRHQLLVHLGALVVVGRDRLPELAGLQGVLKGGRALDRHEGADHVLEQRGRAGGGTDLSGRPQALGLRVGHPQHEVGEGEVGDDLPVGDQRTQPRDVVVRQRRLESRDVVQRGHRTSVVLAMNVLERLAQWIRCPRRTGRP